MEVMIELRNKYADDLEEILQCPVCFENMVGPVPTCVQGHHVCVKCRNRPEVINCPFCKSYFNGSRNYLAEDLATKFAEIKTSLIDPKNIINKKKKICVATQTEDLTDEIIPNNNNEIDYKVPPPIGKGKYTCRINKCSEEHGHGRLVPHLRYYHQNDLYEETITDCKTYSKSWKIQYNKTDKFNAAINLPKMGIFFLIIDIDEKGDLYGSLQIANTTAIAKQFSYKLEIFSTNCSTCYKGQVLANRAFKKENHEKALFVSSRYMQHLVKKQFFDCCLTICRSLDQIKVSKKENQTENSKKID